MSVHFERYVNSLTHLYPEAESNSPLLKSSEQSWSLDSKEQNAAAVTLLLKLGTQLPCCEEALATGRHRR